MVMCFAFGCSHRQDREKCSFFRFPPDLAQKSRWKNLCRRSDRPPAAYDRLCSCHFKEGLKENQPTIFSWNKDKIFDFSDPPKEERKRGLPSAKHVKASSVDNPPTRQHIDDHSYYFRCPSDSCTPALHKLSDTQSALQLQVDELTSELDKMAIELDKRKPFSYSFIKDDTEKMLLYTSIPADVFLILVYALNRYELSYFYGWNVTFIPFEDQVLMTLMKLRLNLRDLDLAERFCTSRTTVANVVKTLICALHALLFSGILKQGIPSQAKCQGSMPKSFSEFVSARIVVDATEITQDIPHELNKQANCYSSYKSRHTVKAVTGVAPNAALVFISDLFPGSISDNAIVEKSKLLDELVPGDLILADKGFTLFQKLPPGVSLNIPPFLCGKSKFTKEEAKLCAKIARARIHVERANERIKNFEILNHIPANLRPLSTKIFQLCCCLVNLQAPLLSEVADGYMCV